MEARLARRTRADQWRTRLPYLAWHKDLVRPPVMARWERAAILVVGAGSGLAVAASGVSPTTSATADLVWSLALGVAMALAGALARRRVLLAVAAVATVGVWGWWSVAGVLALALASGAVYQRDGVITGERLMHAASASLTLQALVRLPGWSWMPLWVVALLAAAAVGAVLVAGWWRSPRRVRTLIAVVVGTGVVAVAVMGATLWRLIDGVSLTDGTALAAGGTLESLDDLAASADDFAAAEQRLADLQRRLDSPLFAPLRAIPVAAQQIRAIDTTVAVGRDLAGRAGDGAALVEGGELRPAPGQVDVAAVRSLEAPLADMVASLQAAGIELASVASPLLVGPVRDAAERLQSATVEALPSTELALLGVQTVPGMLGADGPRRWLVQLVDTETGTNEWQVVVADSGRLTPTTEKGTGPNRDQPGGELINDFAAPSMTESPDGSPLSEIVETADTRMVLTVAALESLAEKASGEVPAPELTPSQTLDLLLRSLLPGPKDLSQVDEFIMGPAQIVAWTKDPVEQRFLRQLRLVSDQAASRTADPPAHGGDQTEIVPKTDGHCSLPDFARALKSESREGTPVTVNGAVCKESSAIVLFKDSSGQALLAQLERAGSSWRVMEYRRADSLDRNPDLEGFNLAEVEQLLSAAGT